VSARPREGWEILPSSCFERLMNIFEFFKNIVEFHRVFAVFFSSFEIRALPLDQEPLLDPKCFTFKVLSNPIVGTVQ
jgi:hypothetical protein